MQDLTPNEHRHAASMEEIQESPYLLADCGSLTPLGEPLGELLPLSRYNAAWRDVELGADLMNCALRFTELRARWETVEDDDVPEIYGEFSLLYFHDVFNQPEEPATYPGVTDFQRSFISELRVFDHTPLSGAGKLAYIRMQPGATPLEIWYSAIADIGSDPYPPGFIKMDITYCEYLSALLRTKGTYGWQYLYTDISLRDGGFHETVNYLQGMLEFFPQAFPQHDYTDLRDRLEARL